MSLLMKLENFDAATALKDTPKTKEGAIGLYDAWSSTYDRDLTAWGYPSPRRVAEILSALCASPGVSTPSRAEPLLDCGCGTGLSGEALRDAGFTSRVGTDISSASLSVLRERKPDVYRLTQSCDLDELLPFDDASFAFVTCVGVLGYVAEIPSLFAEWRRVVQPGGVVAFSRVASRDAADEKGSRSAAAAAVDAGEWELLYESEGAGEDYLPENPEPGERGLKVKYYVYRSTPRVL